MIPKISVIMPALNVARYISECVESVLNQTMSDIEIIIVDAGSTDGTLEIIKEYAEHDSRIRIVNSEKKSYGYQVNLGIQMSTGRYVGIIETDDVIELDMYEYLYSLIEDSKCNYVKGTAEAFWDLPIIGRESSTIEMFKSNEYDEHGIITINPSNNPQLLLKDRFLWNGLYESEFIKRIRLNETAGAAFQDIGFLVQVFTMARKAVYSDRLVHHYRQDNTSASGFSTKCFTYLNQEYNYVESIVENRDKKWKQYVYGKLVYQLKGRFLQMAMAKVEWKDVAKDVEFLVNKVKNAIEEGLITKSLMEETMWEFALLLVDNAEQLYENGKNAYAKNEENVILILEKVSKQETVIFGCGDYGKFVVNMLIANGINTVINFCDNNEKIWSSQVCGYEVLSPSVAVEQHPQALFLVANLKHAYEICKQLMDMGISENNIIGYKEGINRRFYYLK